MPIPVMVGKGYEEQERQESFSLLELVKETDQK